MVKETFMTNYKTETMREIHNEAIQKEEVFKLHQDHYDGGNHLETLWQDVQQVSSILTHTGYKKTTDGMAIKTTQKIET